MVHEDMGKSGIIHTTGFLYSDWLYFPYFLGIEYFLSLVINFLFYQILSTVCMYLLSSLSIGHCSPELHVKIAAIPPQIALETNI